MEPQIIGTEPDTKSINIHLPIIKVQIIHEDLNIKPIIYHLNGLKLVFNNHVEWSL